MPYDNSNDICGSLYLFGIHNEDGAYLGAGLKLYRCKLYQGEKVIRDYIPCINDEGQIGLYDLVKGKFYGNNGTGTFINGPVIEKPYTELEYIESSGEQWIDTGLQASSNLSVDLTVKINNYADCSILGTNTFAWGGQYAIQAWSSNLYLFDSSHSINGVNALDKLEIHADPQKGASVEGKSEIKFSRQISESGNIYMFKWGNTYGSFKLYACKFYENGVLIRDFIPVQMKDTREIGLYDKVNDKFYGNSGSGTFIAG